MTFDSLLDALSAAGVLLAVEDGRLRIDAPAGALTPELRAALAEHKAALLAHLASSAEPAPALPEILRVPLEPGSSPSEWLAARGLKIVGGTPNFGGALRPMLYVADAQNEE
jgi:hypothetical protein